MSDDNGIANAAIVIEGALRDYARAFNIIDIPCGNMSMMLAAAIAQVRAMGPGTLAKVSAGSATVTEAARTGFSAVYGGISEGQRREELERREANAGSAATALSFGEVGSRDFRNVALAMQDDRGADNRSSGERPSAAVFGKDAPLSATAAIGYARELGINPAHAAFFVGASADMRDALRSAIRDGASITDDKVKDMRDVSAVLGAIRAGKLKPDDPRLPPSVKSIIDDMKKNGIDPATAKPDEIKKYLKDNPGALEKAKTLDRGDKAAVKGLTPEDTRQKVEVGPKQLKAGKKLEGTASL